MIQTLAILSVSGLLFCSAPPNDVEVTHFRAPAGPRAEHVSAIHHAGDGSLWVGTRGGGISRFDGSDWTHFSEEEVGLPGVASIFPAADGVLWFAGAGGVARFDGTEWERFGEELGRAIRVAFAGFVDTDGAVWFGTNVGAVRFDGQAWEWTTTESGLKHDVVHDVQRDRSGNLWFATRRGGLSRLDGEGEWKHFHSNDNVRGIHEDAQGGLWFGTGGSGVHHFDGMEWTRHYPGETVLPLFEDSRGNVWFSRGSGGALRYRAGKWSEHTEHVPTGEIHTGTEGSDKSLWFGASNGLSRLRKVK